MNQEVLALLKATNDRFPGCVYNLWMYNVIHPEHAIFKYVPTGHNVMMADVASVMLKLQKAGIVRPVKFQPSHSRAAFLGLECEGRSLYMKKQYREKPDAGSAADWTWEVIMDTDKYVAHMQREGMM